MVKFLISLIVALWVCAIALIAAQNGAPVAVQFLGMRTIEIPFGLVLSFSAAIGMVGMALALPVLKVTRRSVSDREDFE